MSESDSDEDETKDAENPSPEKKRPTKELLKRNMDDSGIANETCTEDSETNGNPDIPESARNSTPVTNKRSSSSAPPNEPSRKRNTCRSFEFDNSTTAHYVDTNAFSSYMKEKIHQLPLPYSLKLYMNYNRTNL